MRPFTVAFALTFAVAAGSPNLVQAAIHEEMNAVFALSVRAAQLDRDILQVEKGAIPQSVMEGGSLLYQCLDDLQGKVDSLSWSLDEVFFLTKAGDGVKSMSDRRYVLLIRNLLAKKAADLLEQFREQTNQLSGRCATERVFQDEAVELIHLIDDASPVVQRMQATHD